MSVTNRKWKQLNKNQQQATQNMELKTHPKADSEREFDRSSSKPKKLIISNAHLEAFIESATHAQVVDFVESLNNSISGLPLDHPVPLSDVSNNNKRKKERDNARNVYLHTPG